MKKNLMNAGVLIAFYSVIIIGVILLNFRFEYLNNQIGDANLITMNN